MNIKDLRDGMRTVEAEGEVTEISSPREVSLRTGGRARVADATLKDENEPQTADQRQMAGLAAAAGFTDVRFTAVTVPTTIRTPAQLASWRLGMAHVAPFVRGLDPSRPAAPHAAADPAGARAAGPRAGAAGRQQCIIPR